MISDDEALPVDRPNLSKDYLAGKAPEDWIPLRKEGSTPKTASTCASEPGLPTSMSARSEVCSPMGLGSPSTNCCSRPVPNRCA